MRIEARLMHRIRPKLKKEPARSVTEEIGRDRLILEAIGW